MIQNNEFQVYATKRIKQQKDCSKAVFFIRLKRKHLHYREPIVIMTEEHVTFVTVEYKILY